MITIVLFFVIIIIKYKRTLSIITTAFTTTT
jgi:hypothetical protein